MNRQRFLGLVLFGAAIMAGSCPNAEFTVLYMHMSLTAQSVVAGVLLAAGSIVLSYPKAWKP